MPASDQQNEAQAAQNGWRGLAALLERHRGEKHVIVLQEYPDPDAISSALAHRLISRQFEIEADIAHEGRVSHQENLALVRLMEVELIRLREGFDPSLYDGAVFLDNQGTTAKDIVAQLEGEGVPILAMIDHHEPQDMLQPGFSDVQRIGATASIYGSYFRDGILDLDPEEDEHVKVATALMHGILSDTDNFLRATERDFLAAAHLSKYLDVGLLAQIMSQARSRQTMEVIERALQDRRVLDGVSLVGIGYLRAEDRDAIPQAADFLLSEENVQTSIVFGIVQEDEDQETMVGSMRTSKLTVDPDKFIKEVFGQADDGSYFGGGKRTAGAFEIPIEFLAGDADEEYEEMKWQVYETQVRTRLFDRLGIHEEDSSEDR